MKNLKEFLESLLSVIVAVLIIIGISLCVVGISYLLIYLIDLFTNRNNIDNLNLKDSIFISMFSICFATTVKQILNDIKKIKDKI